MNQVGFFSSLAEMIESSHYDLQKMTVQWRSVQCKQALLTDDLMIVLCMTFFCCANKQRVVNRCL